MGNRTRFTIQALTFTGTLAAALGVAASAQAEPKTHDGFYLQADLGVGYLSSSEEAGPAKTTYSGITTPFAFLLGGTVGPVVIGGGFFGDRAASPKATYEAPGVSGSQDLNDVTLTLIGIGMFADIYPDVHKGLHIQPFLGWGGLDASVNGNSGGSDPTGLVTAIGVGYDWWVGDQWSIGVMGRFAYAPLKLNDASFNTIAPALLATFTYH